jgi:hypothetical protein
VAELGGECLYVEWRGAQKPHELKCKEGHLCSPWPNSVQQGRGICRVCAGQDPATAEKNFRAHVAELGGECLYEAWGGSLKPHRVRCKEGHLCSPRPSNIQQGVGICLTCARTDPAAAEAGFRARVAVLGGACLYEAWQGAHVPHRVRCKEGHEGNPYPANVQQGEGICRICKGMAWDVFYVVLNRAEETLKFGITSGDPRSRLRTHKAAGFTEQYLVLSTPEAHSLENRIKTTLKEAGEKPVRGYEYFPLHTLALVADLVEPYVVIA